MSRGLSQHLASEFRRKIESGQWAAGKRLPTTRELAATYQVSVNTIQSAFRCLEAHDLVDRRPRRGGFVKIPPGRRSGTATTIGFVGVFAHPGDETDADEWTQRIVRGADSELTQSGFHLSLFSYSPDVPDEAPRLLSQIEQNRDRLAGMILVLSPAVYRLPEELDKHEIPWITINRPREHAGQNFVTPDVFAGARLIGRCLARMGIDRVAVLSDPMAPGKSSADKFFGLLQGYVERGMPSRNIDFVDSESYHEINGYQGMQRCVERFGVPKVVLASGDLLAVGAIRHLRERGLRVPQDVGVIGATGLKMAEYTHPPLTVLATPMERMGQEAALMLQEMARGNVSRLVGRYVPAPLIVRQSFVIPDKLVREESAHLD